MDNRGTGRTLKGVTEACEHIRGGGEACFVVEGIGMRQYVTRLLKKHHPDCVDKLRIDTLPLRENMFRGRSLKPWVDHAARLRVEDYEILEHARARLRALEDGKK